MPKFRIRYQYGSYKGERTIFADDSEEAIAKMWRNLQQDMTLPMAYKSQEVLEESDDEEEEYGD